MFLDRLGRPSQGNHCLLYALDARICQPVQILNKAYLQQKKVLLGFKKDKTWWNPKSAQLTKIGKSTSKYCFVIAFTLRKRVCLSNILRNRACFSNILRNTVCLSNSLRNRACLSNILRNRACLSNILKNRVCLSNILRNRVCLSNILRNRVCLSNILKNRVCLSNILRNNQIFLGIGLACQILNSSTHRTICEDQILLGVDNIGQGSVILLSCQFAILDQLVVAFLLLFNLFFALVL